MEDSPPPSSSNARGYWPAILAALGAIALATLSYHVGENTERRDQGHAFDKTQSVMASEQHAADQYENACGNPPNWARAADCAVISAANAANVANIRAEQDARWNHFGILAGFLTLGAALIAAFYARKAANESWRAANAAIDAVEQTREANRIAQLGHDLEFRPIIAFEDFNVQPFGTDAFLVTPIWRNIGRWPAYITDNANRRIYIDHVPQQRDVVDVASDAPHRVSGAALVPADGRFEGAAKIVNSSDIDRVDVMPGFSPEYIALNESLTGMGRFRSKKNAFFTFDIAYRAPVGIDTIRMTEQLLCICPIWNEAGRMNQEKVQTLIISHLKTSKMT